MSVKPPKKNEPVASRPRIMKWSKVQFLLVARASDISIYNRTWHESSAPRKHDYDAIYYTFLQISIDDHPCGCVWKQGYEQLVHHFKRQTMRFTNGFAGIVFSDKPMWLWVKTLVSRYPRIAGSWMFIPRNMGAIGFDPSPCLSPHQPTTTCSSHSDRLWPRPPSLRPCARKRPPLQGLDHRDCMELVSHGGGTINLLGSSHHVISVHIAQIQNTKGIKGIQRAI